MMYGLVGMAGMTRGMAAQHTHHHGLTTGRRTTQASIAPPGAVDEKAPGVTGQGSFKFKLLYTADHLPPEAQKVLVKAHGGFAVDRRHGKEETYFALPGAGILRISPDLKSIDLLDTTEEMRNINLHDTNIWYTRDGTPYLVLPANGEGRIYTSTLDGKMVHRLDAPTAAIEFKSQDVQNYFVNKGNFAPTAVEYWDGMYYITTGYCKLDYVLTAMVIPGKTFDAAWNSALAFGGRGTEIGKFGTGHGITKPPRMERLDVADRPHNRFERFSREGQYLSLMETPKGSLPCDINYLDHKHSVVPALEGPDKTKGAPIYLLEDEKIVSTIMIKEDLGLPNFTHVHNAAVRKIGHKLYIMALAWNPGDFAILEQV
jgi:hypothetical protein